MHRNDDHLDAEVIDLGVASEVTKGSIVGPLDTKGGRDFGAAGDLRRLNGRAHGFRVVRPTVRG